jgi:hypothetical protein
MDPTKWGTAVAVIINMTQQQKPNLFSMQIKQDKVFYLHAVPM